MKLHSIHESLEREIKGQQRSDRFYKEILYASKIERIPYDTDENKELQRCDIDVYITTGGEKISVSEKDRNRDFNDLLIEFYSIYPDIPGWMENSKAQMLAYFFPERVIWLNKLQLVEFYHQHLKKLPVIPHFENLKDNNKTISSHYYEISGKMEKVSFIAAYNQEYITMSISVSFDLLKRAGVEFKVYKF